MNLAEWNRMLPKLEREYDDSEDTLGDRIGKAREYIDAHVHRAEVVAELPAAAPFGYLLMTPRDPFLYVGAGMANPLRRVLTQALP